MRHPVICLDGPAASGKTTVARALSDRLGYFYLDTGVLYRAVTWKALRTGVSPSEADRLADIVRESKIEIRPAPSGDLRQSIVLVDGIDASLGIRTPEVDANVSEVSAHPAVRTALIDLQRSIAEPGGVIMAGRDMGTVICPNAEVKVYLDASVSERARRRQRQAREQGVDLPLDTVLDDLRRRDAYDSGRSVAPLRAADDALIIDSTGMTVEEVVEAVSRLVSGPSGTSPNELDGE